MKMIKLIGSVSLLCATALSSMGQTKDVTINGTLTNMTEMPSKIYLLYAPIFNLKPDSATVTDGKYKLLGSTAGVVAMATLSTDIKAKQGKNTIPIFIDKGELQVVSDENLQNTKVSGAAAGPQQEFEAILKPHRDTVAIIKKEMESERFKTDKDFQGKVNAELMGQLSSMLSGFSEYALKNPKSALTPYLTWSILAGATSRVEWIDSLQRNLPASTPQIFKTEIAKVKDKAVQDAAAVEAKRKADDAKIPLGSKALDFTMNNIEGKPVSLSSFKGKYVLVDFWASWCVPCRKENPNVVKNYNQYKEKGFTILGVSLDAASTKAAWLKAIESDGLTWTQVSDLAGWKNAAAQLYNVGAIPQNFLIDPNGIVIAKNLRGEELQQKLASLFNK